MHEVLVNRLGGLSLPRKSVVRLTDRPDMTLEVYRGRKTTMQHVLSCLRKKIYRYIDISVILSPIAGFLLLVRVTQFSQFEKGILCP